MLVLGIDEVGRGSIAGPLVVGAVALKSTIDGLKDSKLLSRARRARLAEVIYMRALYTGLGWATAEEIDTYGLSSCLKLAAERSLAQFELTAERTVLDGRSNYLPGKYNTETVIGGDNLIPAVSAASIIAKVARDKYMIDLGAQIPGYSFETNVGYCTPAHVRGLLINGCSLQHRKTFEPVKSILFGNSSSLAVPNRVLSTAPAS